MLYLEYMTNDLPVNASEQSKKLFGVVMSKKNELYEILKQNNASNLHIFGSVAVGDANADSDIDMIYSSSSVNDLLAIIKIARQLSDVIGAKVDAFPETSIDEKVLAELKNSWILVA